MIYVVRCTHSLIVNRTTLIVTMDKLIKQIQQNLESIKHTQDDFEYWSARDLMPVLGYSKWERFEGVIKKAMQACKNSSQVINDHFPTSGKPIIGGKGATQMVSDYLLTRYACYLIAQNGDSRKPEIAFAQTYFAVQTRRQEINEQRMKEDRRLDARAKLKDTEAKIGRTIYERGIKLPVEFATFKNKHIEALYGGMSTKILKKKRNIPKKRALADFDTHVELKAKDFALAITDHNIKKKDLAGKPKLEKEVVDNSKATRKTLLQRGIKPEDLKPEEDLKKIEKRRKEKQKSLSEKK